MAQGWRRPAKHYGEEKKNKPATFQGRGEEWGGLVPTESRWKWKPREQKGGKASLKEARISPPSTALALSDAVMLIGGTGDGVIAPACLSTSPRLGYDKNSALNHSL